MVVWALQYKVYEDLYAAAYEWIEPEITKAELKCEMMARINLELVDGQVLCKTHFRRDKVDDTWWPWTHDPEEQVAASDTDSNDIDRRPGGWHNGVRDGTLPGACRASAATDAGADGAQPSAPVMVLPLNVQACDMCIAKGA